MKPDLSLYHPAVSKIISLLRQNNFWHEYFEHKPVITSEEAAKIRTGYSLSEGAKALIIKFDQNGTKDFAQLIVPADKRYDSNKANTALGIRKHRFATKDEIDKITDGVEIGGVPPFGRLFSIPVYMDKSFLEKDKMIFNAGDRRFSIAMKVEDYQKAAMPELADLL